MQSCFGTHYWFVCALMTLSPGENPKWSWELHPGQDGRSCSWVLMKTLLKEWGAVWRCLGCIVPVSDGDSMHWVSLQPVIQAFLPYCTFGNYLEVARWTSWWLCAVSSARRAPALPAVMHAGCLIDFVFAHGRRQSLLGGRAPKAFIQASCRLERGEKAFKAFCFRSFTELAQSGLITVLKSSYVITMRGCAVSVCACGSTPLCMREKDKTTITIIT